MSPVAPAAPSTRSSKWLEINPTTSPIQLVVNQNTNDDIKQLRTTPVNLITVFGAMRTGKSFLLNRLMDDPGFFKVLEGNKTCTVGADISRFLTHGAFDDEPDEVVYQAIFFRPCPQLVDIVTKYETPPGIMLPKQSMFTGPCPLFVAMEKGHLPSWNKLYIEGCADVGLPILTRAIRAGNLNRVKELETWECNDHPSHLRSFLEALRAREGKLEAVQLQLNAPDDLPIRRDPCLDCRSRSRNFPEPARTAGL
jgi:hypothetical protein